MSRVQINIRVNGKSVLPLQDIFGEINSLDIMNTPEGLPKFIKEDSQKVADWLYDISQRAESITYNRVIMTSNDVDKWR